MNRIVCLHMLPDVEENQLPDFVTVTHSASRQELMTAIGAVDGMVLLLDLDDEDSFNTISSVLEVKPLLPIVGITGSSDLNRVLQAQRLGVRQVATRPLDAGDIAAVLSRAWNTTVEEAGASKTYCVIGTTGGAGTTTIAANLAVELATIAATKSAIIDLDFDFGGVARAFDLAPRFSIADLASAGAADTVLLHKTVAEMPSGAGIIARPPSIRQGSGIDEQSVRRVIKLAARSYPFVICDLPRVLDGRTGAAIEMCEKLLVVVQLTVPGVDNARRLIEALGSEGIPQGHTELIVNRYRKNTHACTPEMVEKELGQKVFAVIPNDYAAVNRAIDSGKPLENRNPVRAAIADLASRLSGKSALQVAGEKKNWLSSLGFSKAGAK
ncbi:MAG: CpaE family protein [Phycisphaerae bacterium]